MATRKTWNEKLCDSKDLPKIVQITGKKACSWGKGSCVVPAPLEVDHLIRQVKRGRLVTSKELRETLATFHQSDTVCPIVTGISCWISAHAAVESEEQGARRTTPWWRALKAGGELNSKYPGGLERQCALLEAEGHTIIAKGKRLFVSDYERRLAALDPATLSMCQPGARGSATSRRKS